MRTVTMLVVALMGIGSAYAGKGEGGSTVGNGGGLWVCQNLDQLGTIRWARLVDLFEGRVEFGMNILDENPAFTYEDIVKQKRTRLWAADRDFYESIDPYIEKVLRALKPVDADLEIVNDALYRLRPHKKYCALGKITYVQLANYTSYGKILLQKDIWNDGKLSNQDKAALIVHEAVYWYLRDEHKDANSVRAREIVAAVFSDLCPKRLAMRINKVLTGEDGLPGKALGMKFAKIKAGTFMMGSPEYEAGRYNNEKLHPVTLTHDFELQTTEVTQWQWYKVMGNNPSVFKNAKYCPQKGEYKEIRRGGVTVTTMCMNHPVETVSYHDVETFINRLNSMQTRYKYRLPTEAEWEYAARAGSSAAYSFGSDTGLLGQYAWYDGNSGNQTQRVATKAPNAWGLYDVHGNVWEWTRDWYAGYGTHLQYNPHGGINGASRVVRGGSWGYYAWFLRAAFRNYFDPGYAYASLGLRLSRTSKP